MTVPTKDTAPTIEISYSDKLSPTIEISDPIYADKHPLIGSITTYRASSVSNWREFIAWVLRKRPWTRWEIVSHRESGQ